MQQTTPISILQHDGVVSVTLRTFGRNPTFDVVGRFEEAALADHVLSVYAIADGLEGDAITKLNIHVGDYTITTLRSEYAQVALVVVTGHKIMKSCQRMMERLVRKPKDWEPVAQASEADEPRGLAVVR